jgi:hypothetical protein
MLSSGTTGRDCPRGQSTLIGLPPVACMAISRQQCEESLANKLQSCHPCWPTVRVPTKMRGDLDNPCPHPSVYPTIAPTSAASNKAERQCTKAKKMQGQRDGEVRAERMPSIYEHVIVLHSRARQGFDPIAFFPLYLSYPPPMDRGADVCSTRDGIDHQQM